MDDNKEYEGQASIEDLERGEPQVFSGDNENIEDIQEDLRDIEDAIKRTSSFETELGLVGQIRGILEKIKSGVVSSADIENLLKQAGELKKSVEKDVNNIKKFDEMSKRHDKILDDILEKSDSLIDKLSSMVIDEEQRDNLIQDIEKTKEKTEEKKITLLPFIGELKKRLEKIKDHEDNMLGLIDKIQTILGIEIDEPTNVIDKPEKEKEDPTNVIDKPEKEKEDPTNVIDKPVEQTEKKVEDLKKELNVLELGLLELIDDWGKTPEAQNIAAEFQIKNNMNDVNEAIKSNNDMKIDNSKKRMREVDEKTKSLEQGNNIKRVKIEQNSSISKDNSKQKDGALEK